MTKITLRGHAIRWHKPINLQSLLRAALVAMLTASFSMPAVAAERRTASHPSATVDSGLSPAVAIAMALGVRTVQGPVEQAKLRRAAALAARTDFPPPTRQAMLLPSDRDASSPYAQPELRSGRKDP